MKLKTMASVALGLALVASQASAQVAVAKAASPARAGVTAGVQRAGAPMNRGNKFGGGHTGALIAFAIVGGVIIYEGTKDDKKKSP